MADSDLRTSDIAHRNLALRSINSDSPERLATTGGLRGEGQSTAPLIGEVCTAPAGDPTNNRTPIRKQIKRSPQPIRRGQLRPHVRGRCWPTVAFGTKCRWSSSDSAQHRVERMPPMHRRPGIRRPAAVANGSPAPSALAWWVNTSSSGVRVVASLPPSSYEYH